MKYKQYQKYKDSGVEWIGEIPEGWEVKKLKFVANFDNSTVDRHVYDDEIPVSISHYPQVYNNETISLKTELPKGTCSQKEFENFRLKKDDVLITKDSETADDIGVPVYILDDFSGAVCGYHIAQISTDKNQLFGGFLFRFIQSSNVNAYFETEANGVTRYGLGKDSISNLIVPLPPKLVQEQIYDFLQKETAQFDNLISKYQSQINFLQEKRQALITHTVTKGLDPTVPMKDSGVDWIGEIPEHWEVNKIKFNFEIKSGKTLQDSKKNENDLEVPYITAGNVFWENVDVDDLSTMQATPAEIKKYQVKNGDLLVCEGGESGRSAILQKVDFDCIIQNHVHRLRPMNGDSSGYLLYSLESIKDAGWFEVLTKRVTLSNLPSQMLANIKTPVPSEKEQNEIYDFLKKETTQFDNLISKSKQQVNFLQEKRQALITSAVTGKIDVRK